jgi:excisionase family DNA binding protein
VTILTVEQAAELMHFTPHTIRRLAARGEIPGRRIGGVWRFCAEQLEQSIKEGAAANLRQPVRAPLGDLDDLGSPDRALPDPRAAEAIAKFERLRRWSG